MRRIRSVMRGQSTISVTRRNVLSAWERTRPLVIAAQSLAHGSIRQQMHRSSERATGFALECLLPPWCSRCRTTSFYGQLTSIATSCTGSRSREYRLTLPRMRTRTICSDSSPNHKRNVQHQAVASIAKNDTHCRIPNFSVDQMKLVHANIVAHVVRSTDTAL